MRLLCSSPSQLVAVAVASLVANTFQKCRQCNPVYDSFRPSQQGSWLCGFCSVFHDLPYGFLPRKGIERPGEVRGEEFDHFYQERKDLTEAVVEYPMGSNYRSVGSLPMPIWVVGEGPYKLPEGKSGCVLVVTSRCVNAVCKGNSCVSLTDFEDLIVPVPLAR